MPRGISRLRQAEKQNTLILQTFTKTALAADVNDYDLSVGACFNIGATGADRTITGILGGIEGRVIELVNYLTFNLLFPNESLLSVAGNRFVTPDGSTYVLGPNKSIILSYNNAVNRWIIVSTGTTFDPVTDTPMTALLRGNIMRRSASSLFGSLVGSGLAVAFASYTFGDITKQNFAEVSGTDISFTTKRPGNCFAIAIGTNYAAASFMWSKFGVAFDGDTSPELNVIKIGNGAGDDLTYDMVHTAVWVKNLTVGAHFARIWWGKDPSNPQNIGLRCNATQPLVIAVLYPG